MGFDFRSFCLFLYCVLFASLLSLKLWILCLNVSPNEITVCQVTDDGRKLRDLQAKPQRHMKESSQLRCSATHLGNVDNVTISNRTAARYLPARIFLE